MVISVILTKLFVWNHSVHTYTYGCHSTAVVYFLRDEGHIATLAADFAKRGMNGLAQMLQKLSLPNFANWRWTTLRDSADGLAVVWNSFRQAFRADLFKKNRDQSGLKKVCAAIDSDDFTNKFTHIHWIATCLHSMSIWIGGCSCHSEELISGMAITCRRKGKRVVEAYEFAVTTLGDMRREAETWTVAAFANNLTLMQQFVGAVRFAWSLGLEKLRFLDRVPWLFARLEQSGVRDRCLEQWRSAAPHLHHKVSRLLLENESDYLADVQNMNADGTGASVKLKHMISRIQGMSLDDSLGEGPHAVCSRVMGHARSAKWPFVAATCRIGQNLQDVDDLAVATDSDLQTEWTRWSSILQTSPNLAHRPVKIKRSEVERRIYFMEHCLNGAVGDRVGQEDGNEPGDGDEPGSPHGAPDAAQPLDDLADAEAHGGPGGGGVIVAPLAYVLDRSSTRNVLLREFLAQALRRYSYITVGDVATTPIEELSAYQILELECRNVLVPTFDQKSEVVSLYKVLVQPLTLWATSWTPPGTEPTINFYMLEDPVKIDVLQLCGGVDDGRTMLRQWTLTESDVGNCYALVAPQELMVDLKLSSLNIPTLCLMDALHLQGFVGVGRLVIHSIGCDNEYDQRKIQSKKAYLQCVLGMARICAAGVDSFRSTHTKAFFQLLLRDPANADAKLTARQCQLRVALLDGVTASYAILDAMPVASSSVLESLFPTGLVGVVPIALADDMPLLALLGGPADDASSVAAGGDTTPEGPGYRSGDEVSLPATPPEVDVDEYEPPKSILGHAILVERRRMPDGTWQPEGLRAVCPNPEHACHSKFRSFHLDREAFGPHAAEYFLGAWIKTAFTMDLAAHRRAPTRAAIAEFRDMHG